MGDDAHQPVSLCQVCQGPDSMVKELRAQGSKAFINKHGVQFDPSGRGLDLVGQAKGQGQRGQEGFSS